MYLLSLVNLWGYEPYSLFNVVNHDLLAFHHLSVERYTEVFTSLYYHLFGSPLDDEILEFRVVEMCPFDIVFDEERELES